MKKLLIIDAYALFYKSFYAFINNPLTNKKGEETSVIFASLNSLYKVFTGTTFDYCVCALDSDKKTFRHKLDKNYKANRPPMPDALKKQINYLIPFLQKLGLPMIKRDGYEADDIIGTLCTTARKKKIAVEILSSDKDLLQFVSPATALIKFDRKTTNFSFVTPDTVKKRYSIRPGQIRDYLALIGDSADNIPGVKGIGPKSAVKLLQEYDNLEKIYQNLNQVKPASLQTRLVTGKKNAFLSQQLITIKDDIRDIPDINTLKLKALDPATVLKEMKNKEMFSLIKKFNLNTEQQNVLLTDLLQKKQTSSVAEKPKTFTRRQLTPEQAGEILAKARRHGIITFDLETTDLDPFQADIIAAVFVFPDYTSFYIRFKTDTGTDKKLPSALKKIFSDSSIKKTGHNLKFEYMILKNKGIELNGLYHDTMLAEYIIDSSKSHYNLENIVQRRFHIKKNSFSELLGKEQTITDIKESDLKNYTFADGEFTYLIYEQQQQISRREKKVFREIEMPLIKVLAAMETEGIIIDTDILAELSNSFGREIKKLTENIYQIAGHPFNVNSTKQLQQVLFDEMKIKPVKKTKTGYSTNIQVLEKLAPRHEIAELLLIYRTITKLKNTYTDSLPRLVHPLTGRVHTSYNQTVTTTGRLSSSNPNLQNIPVKIKEGRQIRSAFTAPSGQKIISLDYSQVELRVLAQLASEPAMLKAYQKQEDIHKQTAAFIFNTDADKVSPEQRRQAKTINFSVIYGKTPYTLAADLHIAADKAREFITTYFKTYARIKNFRELVINAARKKQYVETYYGRRRYLHEITSSNMHVRNRAERMAFNAVIQGTASDIIKIAMRKIYNQYCRGKITARMVMQVHDELVFYADKNICKSEVKKLAEIMTSVKPFNSILQIESRTTENWEEQ